MYRIAKHPASCQALSRILCWACTAFTGGTCEITTLLSNEPAHIPAYQLSCARRHAYVAHKTRNDVHRLGLMHTYQGGCEEAHGGDLVSDTPPQHADYVCGVTRNYGCSGARTEVADNMMGTASRYAEFHRSTGPPL